MVKVLSRPVTAEILQDEVRFVLKTLLRDDLFGDRVLVSEAEKLLDHSLTVPFVEYCTFLRGRGLVDVDAAAGSVQVGAAGRAAAVGGPDPSLIAALAAHFADRIVAGRKGKAVAPPSLADKSPDRASDKHADKHSDKLKPMADRISPEKAPEVTQPIVRKVPAMPGRAPDLPPEQRPPDVGPRYDLLEQVGEGSLGAVWQAQDLVLGRKVALKQMRHVFEYVTYIPQDELRRRLKEATLAHAALEHPHVLTVVDLDFQLEVPHVVTRWAGGGDLGRRLAQADREGGAMPIDFALRAFVQCAHALAYAHRHGVVHGGLKPENVLFDAAGNVLLADIGLARVTEKGARTGPPIYVGAGSTSYMAPEQLHEERATPAGDVYALGILLYQMLTGQLPGRRSPMPSQKNEKVPKTLDDVFDRMTQDDAAERYPDGAALVEALEVALPEKHLVVAGTLVLHVEDPWPPLAPRLDERALEDRALEDDGLLSPHEAEALADIPSEELPSAEAEPL